MTAAAVKENAERRDTVGPSPPLLDEQTLLMRTLVDRPVGAVECHAPPPAAHRSSFCVMSARRLAWLLCALLLISLHDSTSPLPSTPSALEWISTTRAATTTTHAESNYPSRRQRPFLFVQATDYTATSYFGLTSLTANMCPTTLVSLASATRVQDSNTCPFYDLFYVLSVTSNTAVTAQTSAVAKANSEGGAVEETEPATATATDGSRVASTLAFNSLLKGPRSSLSSTYAVLTDNPFFYMLKDCTIVVQINSALVPSYSANTFQSYVSGFQLVTSTASAVQAGSPGTTAATAANRVSRTPSDGADAKVERMREETVEANFSEAVSRATTAAGVSADVYPPISLRTTFFYWNQPRLHCLLNAPVLMAMRTQAKAAVSTASVRQQQQQQNATAAAEAALVQSGRGRRRIGSRPRVCRAPPAQSLFLQAPKLSDAKAKTAAAAAAAAAKAAAASSPASSFASCARYLPEPALLAPEVPSNAILTANYLQLSSNIVLKVFSFDVWYQLANPSPQARGSWLTSWRALQNSMVQPRSTQRFTANLSSAFFTWQSAATTAAAADPLEDLLGERGTAYDHLGYNLAVDPARVCTAPALYTVSLNAIVADAASWNLGTSGGWLQANVTLQHRYPSARAVAVVAQCSGVPLTLSVTATFSNSQARPGSGHNYYTSIIYFLFLVCYAILTVIFLVLIVPCGKRRRREREMKEKQGEQAVRDAAERKKEREEEKESRRRRHSSRHHRSRKDGDSSRASSNSKSASAVSDGGSEGGVRRLWQHKKSSSRWRGKGGKTAATTSVDAKTSEEPTHGEEMAEAHGGKSRSATGTAATSRQQHHKTARAAAAREGRAREEVEAADTSSLHSLHSNLSFSSSSLSESSDAADGRREGDVVVRRRPAKRSAPTRRRTRRASSSRDDDHSSMRSSSDEADSSSSGSSSTDLSSDRERSGRRTSQRAARRRSGRRRRRAAAAADTPSSFSTRSASSSVYSTRDGDEEGERRHGTRRRRHHRRAAAPSSSLPSTRRQRAPTDVLTLLCCGVGSDDTAGNENGGDGRRYQPSVFRRAARAVVRFGKALYSAVMEHTVLPLERWWKESYILIMYAPMQWLLFVLLVLKVLLCTLYSAKYSLMSETSFGSTSSSYSLFVVCVIFEITADTLIITLEMLVGMGWGLAFTTPLPTNQIIIVCLATIAMFVDYVFQATCDSDGFNLAFTVNPYARDQNTRRCNSVKYSRIALELACHVHNVLRMFLLSMWLSRTVVPADAAAVQRQRRLRERQLRKDRQHQHQLRGTESGEGGKGSRSSSSSSSSAAAAAGAASSPSAGATRRGNGLTSNPPSMPPPPITLPPPPRLAYPGASLSAMDVYLRYQCMWAPFGMLLVWSVLSIIFSFTFFEPEDYYMVIVFREFQTFYLFAFIVLFLRTSSPEYV